MFADRVGERLTKAEGQVDGNSFKLARLRNCVVFLPDRLGSVYIDNCEDCWIGLGPSDGSVFVRNCRGLTLCAAAQQLRVSSCAALRLFVFCLSRVALEDARDIGLAPYNLAFPGVERLCAAAGLPPPPDCGPEVHNFTPGVASPAHRLAAGAPVRACPPLAELNAVATAKP